MARVAAREGIRPKQIASIIATGAPRVTGCGQNLHLVVEKPGRAHWAIKYTAPLTRRQRQMTLGRHPDLTFAMARDQAAMLMAAVRAGDDPLELRRAATMPAIAATTFGIAATTCIDEQRGGWRLNARGKVGSQEAWLSSLRVHVFPHIEHKAAREVTTAQIADLLRVIWTEKPTTAMRVRSRIEMILDAAAQREEWEGWTNPALRSRVKRLLPGWQPDVQHHKALPYVDAPAFFQRLTSGSPSTAAYALAFTILTASRTGMTIGARWQEIDRAARLWTVPKGRMKRGKEFRIPLSDAALAVLDAMTAARRRIDDSAPIFPGNAVSGAANGLSGNAMSAVLRRMDIAATVHGFRSTFRDYGAVKTDHKDAVLEACLDHVLGDKTFRAYQRDELLERRRAAMADWADYLNAPPSAS